MADGLKQMPMDLRFCDCTDTCKRWIIDKSNPKETIEIFVPFVPENKEMCHRSTRYGQHIGPTIRSK